jgi:hypothetical protein
MIYNFIRTHDCFRDLRPNVEVDLSYTRTGDELQVVAEVLWQRPHVLFPHLAATLKPGADFIIAPKSAPTIGANSGFPQFPEEIELSVDSKTLPLTWDPIKECFWAVVPRSNLRRLNMEMTVTVKTTLMFLENIRHERISRYNIRLTIIVRRSTGLQDASNP